MPPLSHRAEVPNHPVCGPVLVLGLSWTGPQRQTTLPIPCTHSPPHTLFAPVCMLQRACASTMRMRERERLHKCRTAICACAQARIHSCERELLFTRAHERWGWPAFPSRSVG